MITRQFVAKKASNYRTGSSNNADFDHVAQQAERYPHELTNLLWNVVFPLRHMDGRRAIGMRNHFAALHLRPGDK